jgi:hypothetical protein
MRKNCVIKSIILFIFCILIATSAKIEKKNLVKELKTGTTLNEAYIENEKQKRAAYDYDYYNPRYENAFPYYETTPGFPLNLFYKPPTTVVFETTPRFPMNLFYKPPTTPAPTYG